MSSMKNTTSFITINLLSHRQVRWWRQSWQTPLSRYPLEWPRVEILGSRASSAAARSPRRASSSAARSPRTRTASAFLYIPAWPSCTSQPGPGLEPVVATGSEPAAALHAEDKAQARAHPERRKQASEAGARAPTCPRRKRGRRYGDEGRSSPAYPRARHTRVLGTGGLQSAGRKCF